MTSQTLKYACIQIVAALLVLVSLALFAHRLPNFQDIGVYERIGQTAHTAGTIDSEYPPLTSAFFSVLTLGTSVGLPFEITWPVFVALMLIATLAWISKVNGLRVGAWSAVGILSTMILLSPEMLFSKYDSIIGLLLLVTLTMRNKGWFRLAALFLILAASFKLVPLLLWPLLFFSTPPAHRKEIWMGTLIGCAISILLSFGILGPLNLGKNIIHLLSYHAGREIQVESMWSGFHLLFVHLLGQKADIGFVAMSAQNMNLNGSLVYFAGLCVLAGVAFISWHGRWIKKTSVDSFSPHFLSALFWMLAVTPILSPQYLVWVMPVALTWLFLCMDTQTISEKRAALFAVLLLVAGYGTQWIVPMHYGAFLDQSNLSLNVVHVFRNLALLAAPLLLLLPDKKRKQKARKPLKRSQRRTIILVATALFAIALGLLGWAKHVSEPTFSRAAYFFEGTPDQQQSGDLPVLITSQNNENLHVSFDLTLGQLFPTVYRIKPDDCLNSVSINGQQLQTPDVQFCDYGSGRPINLEPYLKSGVNHVQIVIGDQGGQVGIKMQSDGSDPLLTLIIMGLLLSITLYSGALLFIRYRAQKDLLLPVVFIGGLLLRVLYVIVTPYDLRGHDTGAHIDYINYFAEHLRIPAAQSGWENHQAPLYYMITGLWMKAGLLLHISSETLLLHIQLFSLLLSIISLALTWWMATLLFPKKEGRTSAALMLGIVAVFPTLIFLAARISNDTLYQCLGFLFMALTVYWWQKPSWKIWYLLCALIGLSLLTKVSATTFVPILFLPLLLLRKTALTKKILHGFLGLVLIIALCGWLFVLRFYLEADTSRSLSLGNQGMNSGLSVANSPVNLLTFNPSQILQHPYNNPWDDTYRRQYFPEYFFRSAFTGEFGFDDHLKDLNVGILFFALLAIPLMVFGFIRERCTDPLKHLPFWLLLLLMLAASASYRIHFPYTANQDFRFVVMIIVPLSYYAVSGTALPMPLRILTRLLLLAFILCCALFLLGIAIYPS
jgi:hypothetical protein